MQKIGMEKESNNFTCKHCGTICDDYEMLFEHVSSHHPLNKSVNQTGGHVEENTETTASEVKPKQKKKRQQKIKSALNDTVSQVEVIPEGGEKYDLLQFFSSAKEDVKQVVDDRKKSLRDIKWYLNVRVQMERDVDNGQKDKTVPHFRSKNYVSLLNDDQFDHNLNEALQSMNRALEEFIHKGSNWVVRKIMSLEIRTVKYSPISASSYMELPSKIRNCKGVVNIKNEDQKCFLWSVLAAIHPVMSHPERVCNYTPYENELITTDIEYPLALNQIEKFERQNNFSINVFGYEEEEIFPLYLSKQSNGYKEIDLLYVSCENRSHYCWIKNFNRFLRQTSKWNTHYFCRRCLHGFTKQSLLEEHQPYCNQFDFQKVEYPKEGQNNLEFNDFHKRLKIGFVIYADFECYSKKIQTCSPDPAKPSTTYETKFEPCGYSYCVISTNDNLSKQPVVYRGDNVIENFFKDMEKEECYITEKLSDPEKLIMSEETERQFQMATHCYVCGQRFSEYKIKVRDHCHIGMTGDSSSPNYTNYRGAACQSCNLNLQEPSFIPIMFHNGKNFDIHLLLQRADCFRDKKISCIPNNMEKYISVTIGKLRFLDTYQFMSSSLEKLVDNLANEGLAHFLQFRKEYQSDDVAKLLLRKNEFPYDYIDCEEKFYERQLPPKEMFYNRLIDEPISDENYDHVTQVWKVLNMKTLDDLHEVYVKCDTLQLADVFERFRDISIENYGLDPCHFYTAPGLAWQAALKMSGVTLELITDPTMYNMIELGTRGGISMISQKYAKANNHYIKGYDETKPSSHKMYLDANNLYGWALSEPLPTGMFRFLEPEEIKRFAVHKISEDSKEGYILEVDLTYPQELHDHHNGYPLAPCHKKVTDEELSPYSRQLWKDLNGENKSRANIEKLIPTLEDKNNYILHYRNLQLYTELGMKVTKVHRILEFHQCSWLKSYIQFNSKKRQQAKNDFEKDFYKLMNNSVFGKTMEQLRKHRNVTLVHDKKKLLKYTAKPSFDHFQIFNEHLVGVENKKVNLFLNKPIYVGQVTLDLSKKLMYEFHYRYMKDMYGDRINLLFTDTDSLCYEIMTKDVYEDLESLKQHFDFSGYPTNHPLFSTENKKVPGKLKDELESIPIKEVIGLRPKMYSILFDDNNTEREKKTAKGIKKCAIKKQLRHANYKSCLFDNSVTMNTMKLIRSHNHELYMNNVVKKGLCNFCDKRFWYNNQKSYAYGHYKIQNIK